MAFSHLGVTLNGTKLIQGPLDMWLEQQNAQIVALVGRTRDALRRLSPETLAELELSELLAEIQAMARTRAATLFEARNVHSPTLVWSRDQGWSSSAPPMLFTLADIERLSVTDGVWHTHGIPWTGLVLAEAWTDDGRIEGKVNALPYLQAAPKDDIVALAAAGWGQDEAADEVAFFLDNQGIGFDPVVHHVISHIDRETTQSDHDPPGFELQVDAASAKAWLSKHRPGVWGLVDRIVEPVSDSLVDVYEEAVAVDEDFEI